MSQIAEHSYYKRLYELTAEINSIRTRESVLMCFVKKVAQAVEAKGSSIMLLAPDERTLLHTAAYGLSDWYIRKGPVEVDKSISEALEGKPVAVLDATEDERVQYREQARKEGIASILSVPIMLRDRIIGVIRVYTAEQRHFDDVDIYFTGVAANLGAIALENARFHEDLEQDYDTFRKQILEWRSALGDEWMTGDFVMPPSDLEEIPATPGF